MANQICLLCSPVLNTLMYLKSTIKGLLTVCSKILVHPHSISEANKPEGIDGCDNPKDLLPLHTKHFQNSLPGSKQLFTEVEVAICGYLLSYTAMR